MGFGNEGENGDETDSVFGCCEGQGYDAVKRVGNEEGEGRRVFEKVVWLNDVIFSIRALSTSPKCPKTYID